MHTRALERRLVPARRHTVLILPELQPTRSEGLAIAILADGNRRSSHGGGYAGGARNVVVVAEHLARRPDVAVMVACILSPENIAKRGDDFFFALYKEFIQLGVDIETQGALVGSGVRLGISGDLGLLRARGGYAVALADAIEVVAAMTASVESLALRLILGVGYGRDAAWELDVDIILRTGMEETGVLRLSGLRTGERIANCATTTLWPYVKPHEVDDVIDLCKRRAMLRFTRGHGVSMIVELALALAKADTEPPVRVTIPTSAPFVTVAAALERLYAGPLREGATLTVELADEECAASRRYGDRDGARHELRIVRGAPRGEDAPLAVLAPGQEPPLFTLPDWLPLGHANVYACGTRVQDMLMGIRAAERFSEAHPPLLGRDRSKARTPLPPTPERVANDTGQSARDALADRFSAKILGWAAAAGLVIPSAAWRTAAVNYALTAFFIHFRIPTEWDEEGALWEQRADLTAKYMVLVAAADEGIFDKVHRGETTEQRWARLEASSCFLQDALRSDASRLRPPRVPGAELLGAIADQWREIFHGCCDSCSPAAAAGVRAGLSRLYSASLAEHRPGIVSAATIHERLAAAPPCVADRARAILRGAAEVHTAVTELRALLHLIEVASAIGAGLLFRVAALAAPASSVTSARKAALHAAATLLDYHVRLSNDVSGFLQEPDGDRDPKENVCTILVPRGVSAGARVAAVVQALATCRRLGVWLDGELGGHIERIAAVWPWMGVLLRRGAFVGRRVYDVGHYTTVSRAEMTAIFDEAEAALR